MIADVIAENLRYLRKSNQYTQAEVAVHLQLQRQSYCNYENGKRTPSVEVLTDLANFYQIPVQLLLTPLSEAKSMERYSIQGMVQDYSELSIEAREVIMYLISYLKSLQA